MEIKLLPCPFCGGEAEITRYGTPRYSTLYECQECGCNLETGETFNHGAAWNTRTNRDGLLRAAEIADKWSEYYQDMGKVIAPKVIKNVKQAILKEAE